MRVLKGTSDERNILINWSFEHNLKCLLLIQQHVQTGSLFQFSSVNLVRADVHSNSKEDFEKIKLVFVLVNLPQFTEMHVV